ncbi:nicotinate (nicotinamide) nucleotide adenylyltransferase [Desulforhopalus vacuolatus]|uniref:nicotinate (nicotinamide) nucleotide adenylyltransferase n=1 Tax=Desulforhopalus vacuolatus TaxID=40414 RepID=UPI00196566E6|nr:nicotinate (nicotinamide) nucleotide adenylyltransferase [Desulforhopalus vacuolatus]
MTDDSQRVRRRSGIYGGTFDPFHNGHLSVAFAALTELNLDRVLIMPAATPPHKTLRTTTSWKHRLAMIRLALASRTDDPRIDRLVISTLESELPPPSYTCNTLRVLQQREEDEFFFILGVDAFLEITGWEEYNEIFKRVSIVISPRTGYDNTRMEKLISTLGYTQNDKNWSHPQKKDIFMLRCEPPFISSSDIKEAVHDGGSGKELSSSFLAGRVLAYIRENGLYLN